VRLYFSASKVVRYKFNQCTTAICLNEPRNYGGLLHIIECPFNINKEGNNILFISNLNLLFKCEKCTFRRTTLLETELVTTFKIIPTIYVLNPVNYNSLQNFAENRQECNRSVCCYQLWISVGILWYYFNIRYFPFTRETSILSNIYFTL